MSSPSLGFDNDNNFYILDEYQDATTAAAAASGAVVLQKYDFSTTTPAVVNFTNNEQDPSPYPGAPNNLKIIYQWYTSSNNDRAIDPTMTVDDNQATLPPSVASPIDPTSGNVYVSWTTIDIISGSDKGDPTYNPNKILTTVSSDGGNNFGPPTLTDASTNNGVLDLNDQPPDGGGLYAKGPGNTIGATGPDLNSAITVSQGRAASESGQTDDPGIPGGTGHGHLGQRRQQSADGQYPHVRPRHHVRRFCGQEHPDRQLCHGRHADPDHGQPLQHHRTWTASTSGSTPSHRPAIQYLGMYLERAQRPDLELFQNETVFKNPADPFVGLPSGNAVGVQVNPPRRSAVL